MTAEMKYKLWLDQVPQGTDVYQELLSISGNEAEVESRFLNDLTFGTAGLRGIMGAGTDRMNIYTVRRAALAYGQYIKNADLPDTCAIAYDTRNNGLLFSQTCAVALAEEGIQVYLFSKPTPTPVLSFAVRHLGTGGGVVMTASHNPAAYNGMKCYGSDGCQQTDEPAAEVFERMQRVPMISDAKASFDALVTEGKIKLIYDEVYDAYYEAVLSEMIGKEQIVPSGLKVLYTPLHGTGLVPVTNLFDRLGVNYDVVTAQVEPNGDFPTCPYPNPETAEAFLEAQKAAAGQDYDVIIATDPDADRVAIAIPQKDGSIVRLSGNELGCMLLEFILSTCTQDGTLPEHSKCIKSIVTTPMVNNIAEAYGCENIDVLTGFKYIGSTILGLEQLGRENEVVFAFEESCGFLKGTYARDKDAQIACVLVAALTAACKTEGCSILEKLAQMYEKYGFYKTQVVSIDLDGEKGKALCAEFIDSYRKNAPAEIAGIGVTALSDYKFGVEKDLITGESRKLDFPSSNVVSLALDGHGQVILRPSGTEPKLKIYFFACEEREAAAVQTLKSLVKAMKQAMNDFGICC